MTDVTDVPVALLGYGTVGSAVDRLLLENEDDIVSARPATGCASSRRSCATRPRSGASRRRTAF